MVMHQLVVMLKMLQDTVKEALFSFANVLITQRVISVKDVRIIMFRKNGNQLPWTTRMSVKDATVTIIRTLAITVLKWTRKA